MISEDGKPLVIEATDADKNHNALLVFQIVEDTANCSLLWTQEQALSELLLTGL